MSTEAIFDEASANVGKPYLEAEAKLRDGGNAAVATLKNHLNDPDPVDRLMAKCLLDWMEGRAPDNQRALDYMEGLPKRIARTPIGVPSPYGLARYLNENFGPRVAELLALRLVKEPDWPTWKAVGVLIYLEDVKVATTTAATIRFAAETPNPDLRQSALTVLEKSGDPDLVKKLQAEKDRRQRRNEEFPAALERLMTTTP